MTRLAGHPHPARRSSAAAVPSAQRSRGRRARRLRREPGGRCRPRTAWRPVLLSLSAGGAALLLLHRAAHSFVDDSMDGPIRCHPPPSSPSSSQPSKSRSRAARRALTNALSHLPPIDESGLALARRGGCGGAGAAAHPAAGAALSDAPLRLFAPARPLRLPRPLCGAGDAAHTALSSVPPKGHVSLRRCGRRSASASSPTCSSCSPPRRRPS